MRSHTVLACLLIAAFIAVAVFGLYVPFAGHMEHHGGCPFSPGGTSLCGVPFAHIRNWQSAFFAVFESLLVLSVVLLGVFAVFRVASFGEERFERYRRRVAVPMRPAFIQELYASGILNRKEPFLVLTKYTLVG